MANFDSQTLCNLFCKGWMRYLTLIISLILIAILFYAPSIKLCEGMQQYSQQDVWLPVNSELLKVEHEKAVSEIKMRIEQGDAWFRYKFTLVGALIAALIGYLFKSGENKIEKIVKSNSTCIVLALAFLLAINIDTYNRMSDSVTNQLGNWIAYYVEPAFLHAHTDCQQKAPPLNNPGLLKKNSFYPWEQFIRVTDSSTVCKAPNGYKENSNSLEGGGLHTDLLYTLFFKPHGHLLTWLIYLIYLAVFQQTCCQLESEQAAQSVQHTLTKISFVIVQISLLAFALITHIAPKIFNFITFFGEINGNQFGWWFLIPWFVLCIVNLPYLFIYPRPPLSSRGELP